MSKLAVTLLLWEPAWLGGRAAWEVSWAACWALAAHVAGESGLYRVSGSEEPSSEVMKGSVQNGIAEGEVLKGESASLSGLVVAVLCCCGVAGSSSFVCLMEGWRSANKG